jgi:hypothetical protein
MLFYAAINPLFEWQINEVVIDFPASYEVEILRSPWRAYLGDALSEHSDVFENISVLENGRRCPESDLNLVVNRSRKDELIERLSLTRLFDYHWVMGWLLIEFVLSVAYTLWFTIWHEHRSVSHTTIFTVFAVLCFCFIFSQVMRGWGPTIGNSFTNSPVNCHGTITFSAKLSKMYFSIAVLWFTGILAEIVALVIMLQQVRKAVIERKASSKSAVG